MFEHVINERLELAIADYKNDKLWEHGTKPYDDMPVMHQIIKKLTGTPPKYHSFKARKKEMERAIKNHLADLR